MYAYPLGTKIKETELTVHSFVYYTREQASSVPNVCVCVCQYLCVCSHMLYALVYAVYMCVHFYCTYSVRVGRLTALMSQ